MAMTRQRRRSRRIEARRAFEQWGSRSPKASLLASLSVRPSAPPPPAPNTGTLPYHAGAIRTSLRLIVWTWAGMRFYFGIGLDKIVRRDTLTRRAVRLRKIFEGLGPTFIKVAQQLSARADLAAFGITAYAGALIALSGYALVTGESLSLWSFLVTVASNPWFRVGY